MSLTGCGGTRIVYERPGTGGIFPKDTRATVSVAGADGKLVTGEVLLPAGTKVLVPDKSLPVAPKGEVLPVPK